VTEPPPPPGPPLVPQVGDAVLPPEYPDGTMLHLPDLHGTGYTDVLLRDDAEGHNDHPKPDRHWWSYHRREYIDWPTAVRLGAASAEAHVLMRAGAAYDPWAVAGHPNPSPSIPVDQRVAKLIRDHEECAEHGCDYGKLVADLLHWRDLARVSEPYESVGAAWTSTRRRGRHRPELRKEIVDALRTDIWAERHFGIYAHADDVASTVLTALAPHLDRADRAARLIEMHSIRASAADTLAQAWENRAGAAMGAVLDLRDLAETLITAGRHDGAAQRLKQISDRLEAAP
jgi:hypothetical protein